MILIIRISGQVKIRTEAKETLFRMRLRRKYTAILLEETPENLKLLESVRNLVAFGKIDEKTLEELIAKRGESLTKTGVNAKKVIGIMESKGIKSAGLKPFFRLHPPIGGINAKEHFPRGVLGNNGSKINDLVRRML